MNRGGMRNLAAGAYGVALLLILIPLLDSVLGIWPLRLREVQWRFGAVGLLSRAVMTPLFGLLVGHVVAVYMEHRFAARAFAVLAFASVLLALVGVASLAMDALQMRAQVRAEAMRAFDTASGVALAKYLAGAVVALLLGVGGWRAAGSSGARLSSGPRPPDERVVWPERGAQGASAAKGAVTAK